MRKAVYDKDTLAIIGVYTENDTIEVDTPSLEIINVLYDGKFHITRANDIVTVIEDIPTIADERQQILGKLAELDKIITRQTEQLYEDLGIVPSYEPMVDAMQHKQILRLQLSSLEE